MPNETLIEQRLSAVEDAVIKLQDRLPARSTSPDWLEKVIGSISDEDAFQEALEYGRAYRESDRPSDTDES